MRGEVRRRWIVRVVEEGGVWGVDGDGDCKGVEQIWEADAMADVLGSISRSVEHGRVLPYDGFVVSLLVRMLISDGDSSCSCSSPFGIRSLFLTTTKTLKAISMTMSMNAGIKVLKYPPYSYKTPPIAGPTSRPKLWLILTKPKAEPIFSELTTSNRMA